MFKNLKKLFLQNNLLIYLLLIIAGFLVSFKEINSPLLLGDMDGYARANIGFDIYQKKQLLSLNYGGGMWLPLHQNILGFSIYLTNNPQLGPRLISLILNVLSIPLIFKLSELIFKKSNNKKMIALLSSLMYLFHPLRLLIATQPLSETTSMFFFLLILTKLFEKEQKTIFISIISNIACLIRFEFWFLIPIIWTSIYLDKTKKKEPNFFLYISFLIIPILILVINKIYQGNFLAFISDKYYVAQNMVNIGIRYHNIFLANKYWLIELINQFGLTGIILLIYAIVKSKENKIFDKKNLIFIFIPAYFFFLLVSQVYFGAMEWIAPRYFFPVVISLIPLVSYGLVSIAKSVYKARKNIFVLEITSIILIFIVTDVYGLVKNKQLWQQTISNNEEREILELVEYYDKNKEMQESQIIYLTKGDWFHPMFIYLTQRHNIFLTRVLDLKMVNKNQNTFAIFVKTNNIIKNCNDIKFENTGFVVCKL